MCERVEIQLWSVWVLVASLWTRPPVVAKAFGDDVVVRPDGVIAAFGAADIHRWPKQLQVD